MLLFHLSYLPTFLPISSYSSREQHMKRSLSEKGHDHASRKSMNIDKDGGHLFLSQFSPFLIVVLGTFLLIPPITIKL